MNKTQNLYKIIVSAEIEVHPPEECEQKALKSGQLLNTRIKGLYLHTISLEVDPPVMDTGDKGIVNVTLVSNKRIEVRRGTPIEFCAGPHVLAKGIIITVHSYEELPMSM